MHVINYLFHMERYRSGHNGAVLKTVRVQAHMGSNPILSAIHNTNQPFPESGNGFFEDIRKYKLRRPGSLISQEKLPLKAVWLP